MWNYIKNILIALDQLINAILRGEPDETLSSRAYRLDIDRDRAWPRRIIDTLLFFDHDHCKGAWVSELERRQLPPSMRQ